MRNRRTRNLSNSLDVFLLRHKGCALTRRVMMALRGKRTGRVVALRCQAHDEKWVGREP